MALDLTPLIQAVDVGPEITAVLAIAAALMTLLLAIRGAQVVMAMVRGDDGGTYRLNSYGEWERVD